MIDKCVLYFIYTIIILSCLIIILLFSDLFDSNIIIPTIASIGLGSMVAINKKYFIENGNCKQIDGSNNKLGGTNNFDFNKELNIPDENYKLECETELEKLEIEKMTLVDECNDIEKNINLYLSNKYKKNINAWYDSSNNSIPIDKRPIGEILNYNKQKVISKIIPKLQKKVFNAALTSPQFKKTLLKKADANFNNNPSFNIDIITELRNMDNNKSKQEEFINKINIFTPLAFKNNDILNKLKSIGANASVMTVVNDEINLLAKYTTQIINFKIINEYDDQQIYNLLTEGFNIDNQETYETLDKNYKNILSKINKYIINYRKNQNKIIEIEQKETAIKKTCDKEIANKNETIKKYKDCSQCFELIKDNVSKLYYKLQESIESLKKEKEGIESDLEQKKIDIEKLTKENKLQDTQIADLKQRIINLGQDRVDLENKLEDIIPKYEAIKKELEEEKIKNTTNAEQIRLLEKKKSELELEITRLTSIINSLEEQKQELISLNEQYVLEKSDLTDKLTAKTNEYDTLKQQYNLEKKSLEEKEISLKLWAKDLLEERKKIDNEEFGIKADNIKLNEKIKLLEAEKKQLEQNIENNIKENREKEQKQLDECNSKIRELNKQIEKNNQEKYNLTEQITKNKKEFDAYRLKTQNFLIPIFDKHVSKYYEYDREINTIKKWFEQEGIDYLNIDFINTEWDNKNKVLFDVKEKYVSLINQTYLQNSEYFIIANLSDLLSRLGIEHMVGDISPPNEEITRIYIDNYLKLLLSNEKNVDKIRELELKEKEFNERAKNQLEQYMKTVNAKSCEEYQNNNKILMEKLDKLSLEHIALKESSKKKSEQLTEQIKKQSDAILTLNEEIVTQRIEIEELTKKINTLEAYKKSKEAENEKSNTRLLNRFLFDFVKKINNINNEILKNLKEDKNLLNYGNNIINELKNYISDINEQLSDLRRQLNEKDVEIEKKDIEIETKNAEIKQLNDLLSNCDNIKKENESLNELNTKLKIEVEQLNIKLSLYTEVTNKIQINSKRLLTRLLAIKAFNEGKNINFDYNNVGDEGIISNEMSTDTEMSTNEFGTNTEESQIEIEIKKLLDRIEQLQSDIETKKEQIDTLILENDTKIKEIQSAKETLFQKFKNLLNPEILMARPSTSINDYIGKIYTLIENKINKINKINETNDLSIIELKRQLEKQQQINNESLNKESTFKNRISELELEIKDLQNNIDTIVNQKLEKIIEEYNQKKQYYDSELEKLKTKEYTVVTAIEEKDRAVEEKNKAVTNLQKLKNELASKQKQIEQYLISIEDSNSKLNNYNIQIQKLKQANGNLSTVSFEELTKEIITKLNNYQSNEKLLSQLSIRNEELNLKLEKCKDSNLNRIKELEEEISKLVIEIELQKKNAELQKKENKQLRQKQIQLLLINTAKEDKIKNLLETQNELNNKIKELENIIDLNKNTNQIELEEIKNQLKIANDSKQQLEKKILELEHTLSENTTNLTAMINTKDMNQSEINNLKLEIKKRTRIIIKLNILNNSLLKKIENLQIENSNIKSELLKRKLNNELLEKRLYKNTLEMDTIKEEVKTLRQQLSKQNEIKANVEIIKQLEQANLELNNINRMQSEEFENRELQYKLQLKKLNEELQSKQQQLAQNTLKNNKNTFNNSSQLLNEIKELQKIQSALESEIIKVKEQKSKELLNLESKYEKRIKELIQDKDSLSNKLKTDNQKIIDELKKQYDQQINNNTKELIDLKTENKRLVNVIADLNIKNKNLQKQNNELEKKNKDSLSKIEQLNEEIIKINETLNTFKSTEVSDNLSQDGLSQDSKIAIYKNKLLETRRFYQNKLEKLNEYNININSELENIKRQLNECENIKLQIQKTLMDKIANLEKQQNNENEIKRLNELLLATKSENERLQMKLEDSLELYNSNYQKLQSEINKLKEDIIKLSDINNDLSNDNSKLKNEYEQKLKLLQNQNLIEQRKIKEIITNLEIYNNDNNTDSSYLELKNRFIILGSKYDSNIDILKNLIIKLAFENLNLSKQIKKLENSIANINKLNEEERAQYINDINKEKDRIENFITEKELLFAQLKQESTGELSEKKNELVKCRIEIQKLEKLTNLLKSENEQLKMKLEESLELYNSNYQKLQTEINQLKENIESLSQLKSKNINVEELNNNCQKELKKLQNQNLIEQRKIDKIVSYLKQYQLNKNNESFKELESKFESLSSEYDSNIDMLKDLIIKLAFENLNLSNQIIKLENSITNINKLNEEERVQYIKDINKEKDRIDKFIAEKELLFSQLKQKSDSNELNLFRSIEELTKCKNQIQKLERTIKEKDLEIDELKNELIILTDQINELNNDIKKINKESKLSIDEKIILIEQLNMNKNELENKLVELQKQIKSNSDNYNYNISECKNKLQICNSSLQLCKDQCTNDKELIIRQNKELSDKLQMSNAVISQLQSDKQNLEQQLEELKTILSNSPTKIIKPIVKTIPIQNPAVPIQNTAFEVQPSNFSSYSSLPPVIQQPMINANDYPLNSNNTDTYGSLPPITDEVQIIYKYIDKPSANKPSTNKLTNKNNSILTPFDKYLLQSRN